MGDAIYKSPDGGQHWLPHNVGLKEHVSFVNQFVFHPTDNEKIYSATTVGAYYTKDGGREWEERMAGMKEICIVVSIAINLNEPRVLYAGTTGGIYRSDDGAASWKKINNGLIPDSELMAAMALGVNVIVVDPTNPATVYAGATKGLFRTQNREEAWDWIGQAIPDQFFSSFVIDPTDPAVLDAGGGELGSGKAPQADNPGRPSIRCSTLLIFALWRWLLRILKFSTPGPTAADCTIPETGATAGRPCR